MQPPLNIASIIRTSQVASVEAIDEKPMVLQQNSSGILKVKNPITRLTMKYSGFENSHQQITVDTAARDEQIKRVNDLQDCNAQQTSSNTEVDESLVRHWIKQLTIWNDHITVKLKSGVNIDVDA